MRYLTALLSRSIAKIRSRRLSRMLHRKTTFARHLRCEFLEPRNLMAVIAWDGEASTMNWNDAANWNLQMITTPTTQNPGMPSSDEFWILGSGYLDAGNACLSLIRNGEADGKPYCGHVVFPCMFSYLGPSSSG